MEKIRDLIARHEDKSLKLYICPAGAKTIGVGHNMDSKPLPAYMAAYLKEHGEITNEMADDLLDMDIANATGDCLRLYDNFSSFTPARYNALVDFLFNVGIGTARSFKKARAAINAGDWNLAAHEMEDSEWFKQVKGRGFEIVRMIREG